MCTGDNGDSEVPAYHTLHNSFTYKKLANITQTEVKKKKRKKKKKKESMKYLFGMMQSSFTSLL